MKTIDVVYSPICEANGAFLGQLEEWLEGTDVKINYIPYNNLTPKEAEWYKAHGVICEKCKLVSSVFIDVFYNEKLIATVPLKKEKIEQALNIHIKGHEEGNMPETVQTISVNQFKIVALKNEIEWIPITIANYQDEMTMCLKNYPYGNPPKRFHEKCVEIKKKVFLEALGKEKIVGIYAKYGFHKAESIKNNTVVMEKEIYKYR